MSRVQWWECNSVRYPRASNYREIVLILSKISCRPRGKRSRAQIMRIWRVRVCTCVRACESNDSEEKFHCEVSRVSREPFLRLSHDGSIETESRRSCFLLIFISLFPLIFPSFICTNKSHWIILQKGKKLFHCL